MLFCFDENVCSAIFEGRQTQLMSILIRRTTNKIVRFSIVEILFCLKKTLSVVPNSKVVHILSHSEYPTSSFAFAEHSSSQMLVADNTLISLMNKLKTLKAFEIRLPKMEVKGTRLEYQDFVINLGTASQSQTTKGIILEVEMKNVRSEKSFANSVVFLRLPGCLCSDGRKSRRLLFGSRISSILSQHEQTDDTKIDNGSTRPLDSIDQRKKRFRIHAIDNTSSIFRHHDQHEKTAERIEKQRKFHELLSFTSVR